jgi:anti-sigma-K factor RskA
MSDELNALAGAYALDALDDEERIIFEEHLDGCAECAEEVRGMQLAAAELSRTTEAVPPPQLRSDVLASIARVRPLPPAVDNVVALHRARAARSVWQVAAAACALIAILVSAWGYSQHRAANRSASASALNSVLMAPDLQATTTALRQGNGTIVYSKAEHKVILIGHGLPAPGGDKTYQLWMLPVTGGPISGGTFKPNSAGDVELPVSGDLTGVGKMAISIEPAGGSREPTTDTVQLLNL